MNHIIKAMGIMGIAVLSIFGAFTGMLVGGIMIPLKILDGNYHGFNGKNVLPDNSDKDTL